MCQELLIPAPTLPQISTLLFATLYILCHVALTHFKKPAEFITGTLPLPYPLPVFLLPWDQPRGSGPCLPAGKGKVAVLQPLPLLLRFFHRPGQGGIVESLDRRVCN